MYYTRMRAKSLQSRLTLSIPIDSSPPGSPVLGIFQARVLGWVAAAFSGINNEVHLYKILWCCH